MPDLVKIRRRFGAGILALLFPLVGLAAPRLPNDVYLSEQWYLPYIKATEAWNTTLGFEGVTVAVIDSGIDLDHADLKPNLWRNLKEIAGNGVDDDLNGYVDDIDGWDFVDNDNDPRPDVSGRYSVLGANHGTINAGVIAAAGDNRIGITGVTWQSRIMALRALDSEGEGDPYAVVRAVEYAVHNGAKVINLSFAGSTHNETLRIALKTAFDRGVLVVAAAGNAANGRAPLDLDLRPQYPVCFDGGGGEQFILGVAATDERDRRGTFSNYGASCIDLAAPGTRMISSSLYRPSIPDFDAPYTGYYNGSSLAAPIVSGVAALVFSLDSRLTAKEVMQLLLDSSVTIDGLNPGYEHKLGRGRVDAYAAVLAYSLRNAPPKTETVVRTAALLPPGTARVVVTAPGAGRSAELRLFTPDGTFVRSFKAFPDSFRGGATVATADFNAAGRKATIVVGAGAGGGPHIRIFNENTEAIGGFFAFDQKFSGGVNVAAGDLDGDGRDEIIAGAGAGGGPQVRIFAADGTARRNFFAFDQRWKSGVQVAAGDLDGDGRDEIIAAPGLGTRNPFAVAIFDGSGKRLGSFTPAGTVDRRGGIISLTDVDGDGRSEILVEPTVAGSREVYAYRPTGTRVAAVDAKRMVRPVAVAAAAASPAAPTAVPALFGTVQRGAPAVAVAARPGSQPLTFLAYEAKFFGGVRAVWLE